VTNIWLRPAMDSDVPFLWDMLYLSIYVPPGQEPPLRDILSHPRLSHYLTKWGRPGDRAIIALDGNTPIGAVWMRLFDQSDPGYGFVDSEIPELGIAIVPEYRGRGIGTALLQEIFHEATKMGYQAVSLSVDPNNPALRLYERLGFVKVGVCGTSWTMVKRLSR
jgi:ribosomal-protein-alanine N-acetyltransferase